MSGDEGAEFRNGRYVVTGVLGEGAQGDTLEAIDKSVGRLVAIKRFRVRGAKSWKDVELAEREARVLASLSHASLPAHIDHFEEGGVLYLVMQKIDGESLGALRRRGGVLGRDEVVRLLRDASGILDYLHGLAPPVIHRDIKPSNVILRPDGSFAIVDFGAVRDRLQPEGGSTVVGTFGYMAPEQFQGRALPGSDVYAVGATALCLLTGQEPENLPHQGLALDVAAALRGRADRALIEVLSSMLQPDPDRRAQSIAPLLARLDASSRRNSAPPRGWEPGDRSGEQRGHEERAASNRDRARAERWAEKRARHDERRAAKELRHAERRAWKAARSRHHVPWRGLPLPIVLVGLLIARVTVAFALQIFVPLLLTLLSIVFGRGLRESAAHVRNAGHAADRALIRAAMVVRGGSESGAAGTRSRIVGGDAAMEDERVGVRDQVASTDPIADVELDDAEERTSRRPSRTSKW